MVRLWLRMSIWLADAEKTANLHYEPAYLFTAAAL